MNNFYARLLEELENTENDIWVETVLTGEHAGEKRISRSEGNGRSEDPANSAPAMCRV